MFLKLKLFLASLLLTLVGHLITPSQMPNTSKNLGVFNQGQAQRFTLAGSGVTSTATSIQLSSFQFPDAKTNITMGALNTSVVYGTLEPGTTKEEQVSCLGITQNSDGTGTLTTCSRGLSFYSPFAASTTLAYSHAGAAVFVLSNSASFYNEFAVKQNAAAVTGAWTFSSTSQPAYDGATTLTGTLQLANKGYVDSTASQGAATSSANTLGLVRLTDDSLLGTGTASSTSGAPLVLINRKAASSYNAASSTIVVVTNSSNQIDANFIATTSAYTFTGNTTFSSTTITKLLTTGATTTSLALTGPLNLSGTSVKWPSTQGASSTELTNDGNGNLSFINNDWYLLVSSSTPIATSTMSFTGLPITNHLKIVVNTQALSSIGRIQLQFNGDTAGNYGYFIHVNSNNTTVTDNQISNDTGMHFEPDGAGGTSTPMFVTFEGSNTSANQKNFTISGSSAQTGARAPISFSGAGVWNNTSANITSLVLGTTNTVTMGANTWIRIYGSVR